MICPVNNQVIISWKDKSRDDLEKKIARAGLILPEVVQGETKIIELGEVIACADKIVDRNGDEMNIKAGDKVLFATFHPFPLEIDGETAYSLPASEIVAIIGDGKT